MRILICLWVWCSCSISLYAQDIDSIIDAGGCKTIMIELESKYNENPKNLFAYSQYLHCLFQMGEKRKSKKLIEDFALNSRSNMIQWDRLAYVYLFEHNSDVLSDRNFLMNRLSVSAAASRWLYMGFDNLAIEAMEKSASAMHSPNIYGDKLIQVYESNNEIEKLLPYYITMIQYSSQKYPDLEERIITLMDNPENLAKASKYLMAQSIKDPRSEHISKMLLWIYEKKDEWTKAVNVVMDLEKINNGKGKYIEILLDDAIASGNHDLVPEIYEKSINLYSGTDVEEELILEQMKYYYKYEKSSIDEDFAEKYKPIYDTLIHSGKYWNTDYLLAYTDFYYDVLGDKYTAIDLLEEKLDANTFRGYRKAKVELKLGDYYAQIGDRWDAVLYYARVEKSKRGSMYGEEARFRNARLSYYFGDFDWAKDQLEILKTATQEYIANDALELWLRIVDNTPSDSDYSGMKSLAKSEWYIWQEQYDSATILLNMISLQRSADDPIMADVYLMKAEVAHKNGDKLTEREALETIMEDYKDDILVDDALYRLALLDIAEGKTEDGKLRLEEFLLRFDNSPLLIEVRKKLISLENNT